MTDNEGKALLALANGWEEASKAFEKAQKKAAGLAQDWQEKGNYRQRDLCQIDAAECEIRANLLRNCAEKLALKVGELLAARPATSGSSGNQRATGTERSSSRSDDPKDPVPFVNRRRGEVA